MDNKKYAHDTIIIGGGAAGLSAALVLARAHADVVVVDNHNQSNLVTSAAHGVFTRDGESPDDLYRIARSQLEKYSSSNFVGGSVVAIKNEKSIFLATLSNGSILSAKTVLLAQGTQYVLPDIPGLKELWGDKVWHCPFCHGYEATNQNVLVIADKNKQSHLKQLLSRWTNAVDYKEITDIKEAINSATGVEVVFTNGLVNRYDSILAQTTPKPRDAIADNLGCKRNQARVIEIDEFGRTSVSGVYSAGDQAMMMQQVNLAVTAGHKAGVAIVMELQGIKI